MICKRRHLSLRRWLSRCFALISCLHCHKQYLPVFIYPFQRSPNSFFRLLSKRCPAPQNSAHISHFRPSEYIWNLPVQNKPLPVFNQIHFQAALKTSVTPSLQMDTRHEGSMQIIGYLDGHQVSWQRAKSHSCRDHFRVISGGFCYSFLLSFRETISQKTIEARDSPDTQTYSETYFTKVQQLRRNEILCFFFAQSLAVLIGVKSVWN